MNTGEISHTGTLPSSCRRTSDYSVRIVAENPTIILSEWEWFAGLRRLGKPVEMIAMQDGVHELQKPWERMISLEGAVDSFTFWLRRGRPRSRQSRAVGSLA